MDRDKCLVNNKGKGVDRQGNNNSENTGVREEVIMESNVEG